MSNREKILVGLMLLAVGYGVYTLFLSSPKQAAVVNGDPEQKALNAFIIQVAEKTKTGLSKNEAFVLQKAQADWKRDPLIRIEPKKAGRRGHTTTCVEIQDSVYRFFADGR